MKVATLTKMTVADLDRLPDDGTRYELIDGELFVTPSPIRRHQRAHMRLVQKLGPFVEEHDLGELYSAPFDVHISLPSKADTRVEPDILFISKGRLHIVQDWVYGAPDFVIEILSESTARADLYDKRDFYQAAGVEEYWIVDPGERCLIVHRFTEGARKVLREDDVLRRPLFPGFELRAAYIFQ